MTILHNWTPTAFERGVMPPVVVPTTSVPPYGDRHLEISDAELAARLDFALRLAAQPEYDLSAYITGVALAAVDRQRTDKAGYEFEDLRDAIFTIVDGRLVELIRMLVLDPYVAVRIQENPKLAKEFVADHCLKQDSELLKRLSSFTRAAWCADPVLPVLQYPFDQKLITDFPRTALAPRKGNPLERKVGSYIPIFLQNFVRGLNQELEAATWR
ncbi:MAG: hypothetical protein MRY63_06045 [Neomegalonema sp.]|nr:hypothetical protein [Neomegalonema sp.]